MERTAGPRVGRCARCSPPRVASSPRGWPCCTRRLRRTVDRNEDSFAFSPADVDIRTAQQRQGVLVTLVTTGLSHAPVRDGHPVNHPQRYEATANHEIGFVGSSPQPAGPSLFPSVCGRIRHQQHWQHRQRGHLFGDTGEAPFARQPCAAGADHEQVSAPFPSGQSDRLRDVISLVRRLKNHSLVA